MIFELTKKLSQAFGPSGREGEIADVIKNEIKDHVDEVYTDTLGNLIARKKGGGKKIMIATHMDSIGFAVTYIEDGGFLRFGAVGGLAKADLVNIPVKFKNGTRGVVSHDEHGKTPNLNEFYIDIGAKDKKEAEKMVSVGDFAVFATECTKNGDVIFGPYMDNRISCAIQILAIKNSVSCNNDIFYVFTTQEEVGLRGATVASFDINPDFGIAVDVTDTGDTPNKKDKMAVNMGDGPCVKIMDNSVICNEEVKAVLYQAGEKLGYHMQREVLKFGGTDTAAMQKARNGALVGAISIATRYIHSPCEMVNINDVKQASEVLALAISLI